MPIEKITYRVREIVAATGLSKSTVYALMDSGELPSFKLNGVRLVLRSELEAFIARAVERDRDRK
jgi:excisionase family DNA binding protein